MALNDATQTAWEIQLNRKLLVKAQEKVKKLSPAASGRQMTDGMLVGERTRLRSREVDRQQNEASNNRMLSNDRTDRGGARSSS